MATEKSVMAVIRAARPSFKNNHDRIAFAVHSSFLASGYVLTAAGPAADTAIPSPSTDEVGIENWNELEGRYAFVYANPEKGGKKVLVKCLPVDDKLAVDVLADGAAEQVHLQIDVGKHVGDGGTNYSAQFKDLDKLVEKLNADLLSNLDGSSSKPSSSTDHSSLETGDGMRHGTNERGVRVDEPIDPQFHPSGIVYPPVSVFPSGDLLPGPGAGMYPTRGGFGGSGGMLVGPNDPRWFGGAGGEPGFPGGQPGVPPGARFDPYGPPGVPGFEPNRFARNPRRPGGGIHPDLEHFGSGSDFI